METLEVICFGIGLVEPGSPCPALHPLSPLSELSSSVILALSISLMCQQHAICSETTGSRNGGIIVSAVSLSSWFSTLVWVSGQRSSCGNGTCGYLSHFLRGDFIKAFKKCAQTNTKTSGKSKAVYKSMFWWVSSFVVESCKESAGHGLKGESTCK